MAAGASRGVNITCVQTGYDKTVFSNLARLGRSVGNSIPNHQTDGDQARGRDCNSYSVLKGLAQDSLSVSRRAVENLGLGDVVGGKQHRIVSMKRHTSIDVILPGDSGHCPSRHPIALS